MLKTIEILPGIFLRSFTDRRFKQGCLSFQLLRPMKPDEAAKNALLPAVLLRGTKKHPDLRSITEKLDDLYGASVGASVRRVGDYQTTGLYCSFIEDRFTGGEQVLSPMIAFLRELLLEPVLEDGGFCADFVSGEKKNLIATIESELNDKRAYAMGQLLRKMCKADSYGIPRLGDVETVAAIDAKDLYGHYQNILRTSTIHLFYVGSDPDQAEKLLRKAFADLPREVTPLPKQTPFQDAGGCDETEVMDVTQGKLCLGYTTPITNKREDFAAMQVLNVIFGSGMTSKLFMNLREKLSLCYSCGSSYDFTKGVIFVRSGIANENYDRALGEILRQLEDIKKGKISEFEFESAKKALVSSYRQVTDSAYATESFFRTRILCGCTDGIEETARKIEQVTLSNVVEAAQRFGAEAVGFVRGELDGEEVDFDEE